MKDTIKLLTLMVIGLFSSNLIAVEFKIIRDLTSSSGHHVMVGEFDIKGMKRTHVSISVESKVCLKDLITFYGPNGEVKLEWKSESLLSIQVPKDTETKKEFTDEFIECGFQKVKVDLEVNNA